MKEQIINEVGAKAYQLIAKYLDVRSTKSLIVATTTKFNIDKLPSKHYHDIVNLRHINDIRYINKFIEAINSKLPNGGFFIGCAETVELRKRRILKKFPPVFNYIYYTFDFIIKRVFPKFGFTKGIYFFLTRGQNRAISRAEVLGRLYSCGFEVEEETFINGSLFFVAKKIKEPAFDLDPTYGPLIRLKRVGKRGEIIKVYKMRTMHPYAEYLQDYVFQKHDLQEGGKFKNDFRVSTLGRIMRKLWIDELPMIINLFKGDIKIVGVRPLSQHYFSLYSEELQQKRMQTRPGLIPPFYADMPKTLDEIQESELRYLAAYKKHPILTDIRYLFKALYNILIRHARSN